NPLPTQPAAVAVAGLGQLPSLVIPEFSGAGKHRITSELVSGDLHPGRNTFYRCHHPRIPLGCRLLDSARHLVSPLPLPSRACCVPLTLRPEGAGVGARGPWGGLAVLKLAVVGAGGALDVAAGRASVTAEDPPSGVPRLNPMRSLATAIGPDDPS